MFGSIVREDRTSRRSFFKKIALGGSTLLISFLILSLTSFSLVSSGIRYNGEQYAEDKKGDSHWEYEFQTFFGRYRSSTEFFDKLKADGFSIKFVSTSQDGTELKVATYNRYSEEQIQDLIVKVNQISAY